MITPTLNPNLLTFLTPNHLALDMQLIPPENFYSNRDSIRKAREARLVIQAGTLELNGLNLQDET